MPRSASPPLVSVQEIEKSYPKRRGEGRVCAVDGVSFEVREGEILGLLGPNGAGKTTTIKTICGLVRPDAGTVGVCGLDLRSDRQKALRHISAVLEGNRNLYWRLTVRENLAYFAGNRGTGWNAAIRAADGLLERFDLTDKRDELVNGLSRGMQQKLAIAVAVSADTEVLLLDEPTLGLDVETGDEVRAMLREIAAEGRTIIVSTHDMPVVQDLCERTVIIDRGRVVVDDRVDNLLRLFQTRAYDVRVGAPLTDAQERAVRDAFPQVRVAEGAQSLHVDLADGEQIYRLMDVLRASGAPLSGLDRAPIDFEQVFRSVVRAGKSGVTQAAHPRGNAPGDANPAAAGEEAEHVVA